jgi:hypothetical protein
MIYAREVPTWGEQHAYVFTIKSLYFKASISLSALLGKACESYNPYNSRPYSSLARKQLR